MKGRFGRGWLWLLTLWSGGAVLAFELLIARFLAPTFGSGIDVWAVVVAITMSSLAAGYWIGGRIADRSPRVVLAGWFTLLAGITLFLAAWVGWRVPQCFPSLSMISGLCLAGGVLLVPPLFFFGALEPLLARLLTADLQHAGRVYGGLLAVNTIGGVAGCLSTGLWLIPVFGVNRTALAIATGTCVAGVLTLMASRRLRSLSPLFAIGVVVLLATLFRAEGATGPTTEHTLASIETRYGRIEVIEANGTRAMFCNGIRQTAMPVEPPGLRPGDLIRARDYIELIPFYRPAAGKALLIGMGGGLHARALARYGITVRCVEIDSNVAALAKEFFGCDSEVVVADGRAFLARDKQTYDAIILDAFSGGMLPSHLYTVEAFRAVAEHLNSDGVLVVHLIAPPHHRLVKSIGATLSQVFPHVTGLAAEYMDVMQNVYLFASRAPLEFPLSDELAEAQYSAYTLPEPAKDESLLLTDNRSDLSQLGHDVAVALRRSQNLQSGIFVR